MGFSHAVHALVAAGHRIEDIREYTYRQFKLFLSAARERDRVKDRNLVMLMRVAQHMPSKEFKDFVKDNFAD